MQIKLVSRLFSYIDRKKLYMNPWMQTQVLIPNVSAITFRKHSIKTLVYENCMIKGALRLTWVVEGGILDDKKSA